MDGQRGPTHRKHFPSVCEARTKARELERAVARPPCVRVGPQVCRAWSSARGPRQASHAGRLWGCGAGAPGMLVVAQEREGATVCVHCPTPHGAVGCARRRALERPVDRGARGGRRRRHAAGVRTVEPFQRSTQELLFSCYFQSTTSLPGSQLQVSLESSCE